MQLDMSGSAVLVTGSTKNIGRQIALRFASVGADVVITGRSREAGQTVRAEIEDRGVYSVFVPGDMTDYADVEQVVSTAIKEVGEIEVLVNSGGAASGPRANFFRDTDPKEFEGFLQHAVLSRFYFTKAILEHMITNEGGRIVHVTTDAGRIPTPGEVGPGSAGAAMMMATRVMASEFQRWNINVNAVALTATQDTDMVEHLEEESPIAHVFQKAVDSQQFPLTSDDVAELVLYLAGSKGASPITGQTISMTGGTAV